MGVRKLRFDVRKNHERRKYRKVLTTPPQQLEIKVSLPLSAYIATAAPDITTLHTRLMSLHVLPTEWVCSLLSSTTLTLHKLDIFPPHMLASTKYMLTIFSNLSWVLSVGQKQLEVGECRVLHGISQHLCSVGDVFRTVVAVDKSKLCVGNPDAKFDALIDRHNGTFRGQSGN